MNRRSLFTVVGLALVGAGLVQAQPTPRPNLFVSAAASTPRDAPFVITVDVTVENRGQADSKEANLELLFKPQAAMGSKPKSDVPTMFDPVTQAQPLPALKPGEKKSFSFRTNYQANSSFKNRSGSFKANNIDPTGGDPTIQLTATIR